MSIPTWLSGLITDTSAFPPAGLGLSQAVAEHRALLDGEVGALVSAFAITDVKLPDLLDVLDHDDIEVPLPVSVVVTGGAGAVEPAVRWADRAPTVALRSLELSLRDEDDLGRNARRLTSALDQVAAEVAGAQVRVHAPRLRGAPTRSWLAALDELAVAAATLALRAGGAVQADVPTCGELADAIEAALDREIPLHVTGGVEAAARHCDPETGITRHGFLNIARAVRAALEGEDASEILNQEDPGALLDGFDPETAARTRAWFTGFGSADILRSHDDLVDLGLLGG